MVWGKSDVVTPLDGIGGVAQFYTSIAAESDADGGGAGEGAAVTMEVIDGGHVPFDEVPAVANGAMLRWLSDL